MDFMHQNPFHAEALYDLAEFFRIKGDFKKANEFLETILYVFEDSFGYEFKIFTEYDLLLSFDHNQFSRVFFQAVSRFIDILGKKGCYKSAFEYNKFLVKLNPFHDPVGGLLTLDYNAISSKNFEFLLSFPHQFGEEYYKSKGFSLLYMPNYIYSCALAKFLTILRDNENLGSSEYAFCEEIDFTKATSFKIDHLMENSNVLLIHAILLYPKIINDLINVNEYPKLTLSLGGVGNKFNGWQTKSFKDILNSSIFNSKHEPLYTCLTLQNNSDIEGLNKIMEIYVERSKILWKKNEITLWVKSCLGLILNMVDNGFKYDDFLEEAYTVKPLYTTPFQISRYKGLVKHNFSDHVDRLDLNNIEDNQAPVQGGQNQIPMNDLDPNQGFFSLLLGSLLPWNRIQDSERNQE